jgi:hypothetical protein
MPIVLLQYKRDLGLEHLAGRVAEELPSIVSAALDIPESKNSRLTPEDIEVRASETGKMDVNAKQLEIVVIAHDYPERTANIESRKDEISRGVRKFLDSQGHQSVSGWVWVLPQQASAFGRI